MSRRTDRIARLIQQTVAEIVLENISDPRIKPATLSVTRAEVAEDMTRAKVYCSVIGTDSEQRTAIRALQHAAGRIQELMMKQISLRFTPVLEFVPDVQFKKSLTTLALIQEAMNEIHLQEQTDTRQVPHGEPAEPIEKP
jgi:ribosome-binding factor A